jgi:imidazolonepropionase-like amidohydrolase
MALALVSAACAPAPAPPSEDIQVYKNFTLIDGTDHAPVDRAAMVVKDGRISWVGPATAMPASTVPVTDLSGTFVMPGIINLHGHIGNTVDLTQDKKNFTRESVERNLATYASYGVTTVQSMGTDQDLMFTIRDEQRAGRPTVARVYTPGQGLVFKGGYGGLAGVNEPVATVAEAQAAVNAQAAKKADFIKFWLDDELGNYPKMPFAMTQAIIDAAHKQHLRVLAHVFYLADAKTLADQGIDGFVHSVRDKPIDQVLIDSMKKHGTWQVAETLSREASMFAYGTTPPFASDPFFTKSVSETALQLIKSPERQKTMAAVPHFKEFPRFLETAKKNTKTLATAGIPYGMGTDTGPPGRFPGYFEHWEMALMVEAGLSPAEVVRAATGRGADFLGANDLGTIEASKWADFLVLNANPLTDIRNTRAIRTVYIAGRAVK